MFVTSGCPATKTVQGVTVSDVRRAVIAPGVERVDATVLRNGESDGRLFALYMDTSAVSAEVMINRKERPLKELAPNALAVVNAGFFTPDRRATGLLVSNGRQISPFVPAGGAAGSGVLMIEKGAVKMVERAGVTKERFLGASIAIQAGPRLIENGGHAGIRSDDGKRGNRTIIGRDGRGRLMIAVVVGDGTFTSGPTLFELQRLLGAKGVGRHDPNLALAAALNLDGGPSTGLHVRHAKHGLDVPEAAAVHSALIIRTNP